MAETTELTEHVNNIEQITLGVTFSVISGTIADPFILADTFGAIVDVNQACCDIFGYTKDELKGEDIVILMADEFRYRHKSGLDRLRVTGHSDLLGKEVCVLPDGKQLRGLKKDGTEFPVCILPNKLIIGGKEYYTSKVVELKPSDHEKLIKEIKKETDRKDRSIQILRGALVGLIIVMAVISFTVGWQVWDNSQDITILKQTQAANIEAAYRLQKLEDFAAQVEKKQNITEQDFRKSVLHMKQEMANIRKILTMQEGQEQK